MSQKLNRVDIPIVIRRGLRTKVEHPNALPLEGELGYSTDTGDLYIGDSTNKYVLYAALKHAVVHNGDVVTHNGEIVWN